jgi:serine/threonine protein kinase
MNSRPKSPSSALEGLLNEGDIIGEGIPLLDHPLTKINFPVSLSRQSSADEREREPAPTFEVVRKLGTGSYAVVYLVREVLSDPPSRSARLSSPEEEGMFDLDYNSVPCVSSDHSSTTATTVYGREFAIKCLSKANLDEDALQAQLLEVIVILRFIKTCLVLIFTLKGRITSVTTYSSQYRHPPSYSRVPLLTHSRSRIRSWPRPLLFPRIRP